MPNTTDAAAVASPSEPHCQPAIVRERARSTPASPVKTFSPAISPVLLHALATQAESGATAKYWTTDILALLPHTLACAGARRACESASPPLTLLLQDPCGVKLLGFQFDLSSLSLCLSPLVPFFLPSFSLCHPRPLHMSEPSLSLSLSVSLLRASDSHRPTDRHKRRAWQVLKERREEMKNARRSRARPVNEAKCVERKREKRNTFQL